MTHKIALASADDVDETMIAWLRHTYDAVA
jgi:hypothetical protein